jgi:O-antigen/teichoic acid export membrane protein
MAQSKVIKPPQTSNTDIAKTAGRGSIYITAAKLWFIISGYGIIFALPRFISREDYGLYKVVVGAVSIINAVIITSTQQTVSKYISQDEEKADSVKSKALKLQTLVGGAAALGFFLLAPVIAKYLNDERLTNYLRLASLITLSYSFYAVFIGYFNGQKKFLRQAIVDMAYSTFKVTFIVLFAWLGFGVMGGIGGFALAAASVLALSVIVAGSGKRFGEVRIADLFTFQSYVLLFTLLLNLLQKVDLMMVKALSSSDATIASINAAEYSAAIDIANITYQIIISITFVVFPLVSQSTFADDNEKTRSYISNTLRYSLMIMAIVATLFSANAQALLSLVFPTGYQGGSGALRVVAYGMLFFGMLYVLTTIISASGQPKVSLMIGAMTLAASALLNSLLIPAYGLTGAGMATTAAMLLGGVMASAYLLVKFKVLMPVISAVRIIGCAGLVYAASLGFSTSSKILIVIKLAALGLLYVAALVLSRELGRDDVSALKRVIKK